MNETNIDVKVNAIGNIIYAFDFLRITKQKKKSKIKKYESQAFSASSIHS